MIDQLQSYADQARFFALIAFGLWGVGLILSFFIMLALMDIRRLLAEIMNISRLMRDSLSVFDEPSWDLDDVDCIFWQGRTYRVVRPEWRRSAVRDEDEISHSMGSDRAADSASGTDFPSGDL